MSNLITQIVMYPRFHFWQIKVTTDFLRCKLQTNHHGLTKAFPFNDIVTLPKYNSCTLLGNKKIYKPSFHHYAAGLIMIVVVSDLILYYIEENKVVDLLVYHVYLFLQTSVAMCHTYIVKTWIQIKTRGVVGRHEPLGSDIVVPC